MAADALSRRPVTDEPEPFSEEAECVAIHNALKTGTALGLELVGAGVEHCRLRQLFATDPSEAGVSETAQASTPTLPGYTKAELQGFQASDPSLQVLGKFWREQGNLPVGKD